MYTRFTRQCYQKFTLSNFFYGDASVIPNYVKSLQLLSNRSIGHYRIFLVKSALLPCHRVSSMTMCSQKKGSNIDYKELLEAQKNDNILIIDVREQPEIDETGKLPGSIHIPMGDVSNILLNLSDKDFKDKYGKSKPSKDTKIILSCRSGKRSGMVQTTIQGLGYVNAYNYIGGWIDWESKQKV